MADGTWIQYNAGLKRFDKSLNGGSSFTELDLSGQTVASGGVTLQTVTSTGTQNNLAVTAARHLLLRCNNSSDLFISGMTAGQDGDTIEIYTVNAGNVYFYHQNSGSLAANRLMNKVASNLTPIAGYGAAASGEVTGYAKYIYDSVYARWRLVVHEQGSYIADSVQTITPIGGGTLGAGSGYSVSRFRIQGKSLIWEIFVILNPSGTVSRVRLSGPLAGMLFIGNAVFQVAHILNAALSQTDNLVGAIFVNATGEGYLSCEVRKIDGTVVNFPSGSNTHIHHHGIWEIN